MTTINWSTVDDETATLLDLVADEDNPGSDYEWDQYLAALHIAADEFGVLNPNRLRPLLRGVVRPQRIGAFTHRALAAGVIEYTGQYVISDDTEGRNGGKPCREMRLLDP